jgi:hypothetical protein
MNLSINSYERLADQKHYVYHLTVQFNDWSTVLNKRYSEFLELHRVMKVIQKNTGASLPKFPKKMNLKHFLHLFGEQDMEMRRLALETYMKQLESGDVAKHSKFFVDFIGLPMRYREEWAMYKANQ